MGWTTYYRAPADPTAEIARLCTFETDDRKAIPVKICKRGSTYYVAVRVVMKVPTDAERDFPLDASNAYTFAAVFLTSRRVDAWGYKDMDETSGPCDSEAPAAILDLLSVTTNQYALAWRERCRKFAALRARRLEDGATIRLADPLQFTDGQTRDTFRVIIGNFGSRRKETRFQCVHSGALCRISRFRTRAWEKIDNPDGVKVA